MILFRFQNWEVKISKLKSKFRDESWAKKVKFFKQIQNVKVIVNEAEWFQFLSATISGSPSYLCK